MPTLMDEPEEYEEASGKCAWTNSCPDRAIGLVRQRVKGDWPRPFYVDVPICERCSRLTLLTVRPFKRRKPRSTQ